MPKIHVLPAALCDQIAAGEVLERASSAVKELIENSLDAGATSIEVEIEEGGRKRLCITDNGCGMTPEDAKLSIIRHATSKISTVEDLSKIATMGFRGEALASMAAVSKMTIRTKRAEDETGTCLRIEGAVEQYCRADAVPNGTQITIEDLFYNTPARLKFLKTPATEQRRVYEVIEQFALACYEVSFKLTVDGRVKADYPRNRTLRERAHAVLGKAIYDHLYPIVPAKVGDVSVEGVFGSPDYIASTAGRLFTFVNQRIVKDSTIQSAISRAYREFLHGKQPCVILFVTLPLDLVDVNVHPTKLEIRFQDPDNIFRAVYRAIRQSLEQTPWIKSVDQPSPSNYLEGSFAQSKGTGFAESISGAAGHAQNKVEDVNQSSHNADARSTMNVSVSPFSKYAASRFESLPESAFESPERKQRAAFGIFDPTIMRQTSTADKTGVAFLDDEEEATMPLRDACSTQGCTFAPNDLGAPADSLDVPVELSARSNEVERPPLVLTKQMSLQAHVAEVMGGTPLLPLDMPSKRGYFSSLVFLGQLALTYLLCADGDSLVVVDQHAAHERINYEKLKNIADKKLPATPQGLLFPLLLSLDTRLADVLREFTGFFEALGFVIDQVSEQQFAVRSVPAILKDYDYLALIRDALTDLAEQGRASQFEQIRDNIIATMACHKSIRSGRKMSAEDAYRLFREMDETAFRSNCPHGRPVHFVLSITEIEKRFLRI